MIEAATLTDWLSTEASVLAAFAAVLLLFLVYRQVRAANDQAELAREQMRRREAERKQSFSAWFNERGDALRRESPLRGQTQALREIAAAVPNLELTVRREPRGSAEAGPSRRLASGQAWPYRPGSAAIRPETDRGGPGRGSRKTPAGPGDLPPLRPVRPACFASRRSPVRARLAPSIAGRLER